MKDDMENIPKPLAEFVNQGHGSSGLSVVAPLGFMARETKSAVETRNAQVDNDMDFVRNKSAGVINQAHGKQTFANAILLGTLAPGTKLTVGAHSVKIEKYLSQGGFAHVYVVKLATPIPEIGSTAVLKRMIATDKNALATMRTEVEVMKLLKGHNHVVTYIDSHVCALFDGAYEVFLLMEFCAHGGLIDLMNARLQNRLTESEILKIFSDVAEAVACMHYLQPPLLHRDLKIENVLISSPGFYKLCDFGSSSPVLLSPQSMEECRLIDSDIQKHTTSQYRSPEMVDVYRGIPIDEKSDIWALGVVLYKLCFYTTPFEAEGPIAILNASYTFPSYPSYSFQVKDLIGWMLTEKSTQRPNIYQVIQEVSKLRLVDVPIRNIYQNSLEHGNSIEQSLANFQNTREKISSKQIFAGADSESAHQMQQDKPSICSSTRMNKVLGIVTMEPELNKVSNKSTKFESSNNFDNRFPPIDEFGSLMRHKGQRNHLQLLADDAFDISQTNQSRWDSTFHSFSSDSQIQSNALDTTIQNEKKIVTEQVVAALNQKQDSVRVAVPVNPSFVPQISKNALQQTDNNHLSTASIHPTSIQGALVQKKGIGLYVTKPTSTEVTDIVPRQQYESRLLPSKLETKKRFHTFSKQQRPPLGHNDVTIQHSVSRISPLLPSINIPKSRGSQTPNENVVIAPHFPSVIEHLHDTDSEINAITHDKKSYRSPSCTANVQPYKSVVEQMCSSTSYGDKLLRKTRTGGSMHSIDCLTPKDSVGCLSANPSQADLNFVESSVDFSRIQDEKFEKRSHRAKQSMSSLVAGKVEEARKFFESSARFFDSASQNLLHHSRTTKDSEGCLPVSPSEKQITPGVSGGSYEIQSEELSLPEVVINQIKKHRKGISSTRQMENFIEPIQSIDEYRKNVNVESEEIPLPQSVTKQLEKHKISLSATRHVESIVPPSLSIKERMNNLYVPSQLSPPRTAVGYGKYTKPRFFDSEKSDSMNQGIEFLSSYLNKVEEKDIPVGLPSSGRRNTLRERANSASKH